MSPRALRSRGPSRRVPRSGRPSGRSPTGPERSVAPGTGPGSTCPAAAAPAPRLVPASRAPSTPGRPVRSRASAVPRATVRPSQPARSGRRWPTGTAPRAGASARAGPGRMHTPRRRLPPRLRRRALPATGRPARHRGTAASRATGPDAGVGRRRSARNARWRGPAPPGPRRRATTRRRAAGTSRVAGPVRSPGSSRDHPVQRPQDGLPAHRLAITVESGTLGTDLDPPPAKPGPGKPHGS